MSTLSGFYSSEEFHMIAPLIYARPIMEGTFIIIENNRMVFNREQGFILYNDVHQGRQEGFTSIFTRISNLIRKQFSLLSKFKLKYPTRMTGRGVNHSSQPYINMYETTTLKTATRSIN